MTLINFSGTLVIRHCNQTVHLTCQSNTFTMQSVYPHKTTTYRAQLLRQWVPVFQPTMHEFRDFYNFNKAINKYGMQSGIVKVIPPTQWVLRVQKCYTESNLEQVSIHNPIVQSINTNAPGIYQLQNIERYKSIRYSNGRRWPRHASHHDGNREVNQKQRPTQKIFHSTTLTRVSILMIGAKSSRPTIGGRSRTLSQCTSRHHGFCV